MSSNSSEFARGLFDLEARLRELATDMQLGENYNKVEREYREDTEALNKAVESLYETRTYSRTPFGSDLENILKLSSKLLEVAGAGITEENTNGRVVTHEVKEMLNELDSTVYNLTGEHCVYGASDRAASVVNDVAACIHRTAEFVSKVSKPVKEVGKCEIVEPNSEGEELCTLWDRYTEENNKDKLYAYDDYAYLKGWVVGNKVYIRVGSAGGHRAFVDLKSGKLDYYDHDREVNETMKEMLESAGLSCKFLPDNEGVECTGVTKDKLKPVAAALSLATSMDMRIGRRINSRSPDVINLIVKDKFADIIKDP